MTAEKPYGRRVATYLGGAFLVVLAMNIYMVRTALHTYTGTVTEHPYESGLRYNEVIAASKAQDALGWKASIGFTPQAERRGTLTLDLRDAQGAPLQASTVRVECYRPSQKGYDFTVNLTRAGEVYEAPVDFPLRGLWELRAFAVVGDKPFQSTRRMVVK